LQEVSMAITRVHHVGLVSGDLEQARQVLCEGFGLSIDEHRTPWPDGAQGYDGTTVLEFPIGELYYEIAKPNDTESEPAQFLAASNGRGGIYYISLASNDIAADVQGMVSRGIKVKGDWDGKGPVFLDSATTLGLRLQVTPDDPYFVHPYYRGNGTCMGLAHVGVAGRDVEESRHFWTQIFGLREDKSSERGMAGPDPNRPPRAADDPVHILEYPVGGTVIEISHPTTSDSGTARLVAQRATLGETYHHTAPFCPDVHRFIEQAVPAGLQQIGSIPPREETTRATAWFHPRTCLGMLLEPWNRPPGDDHAK
jgi:catechol 2,3-dioxygenase-like lactoylglutathione lyase family enzyme